MLGENPTRQASEGNRRTQSGGELAGRGRTLRDRHQLVETEGCKYVWGENGIIQTLVVGENSIIQTLVVGGERY